MPNPKGINQYSRGGGAGRKKSTKKKGTIQQAMRAGTFKPKTFSAADLRAHNKRST